MTSPILGVDIAKDKFDCVLLLEGKQHRHTFPNTESGWKKLDLWLEKNGAKTVHACMEATGRLWVGLAEHLRRAQHRVSVVNPVRVKRYAQSRLSRNKNDAVDSALIACFCREQNPPLWNPPSQAQSRLQELTRLISARKGQIHQEKNRLKSGTQDKFILAEINRTIQNLERSLQRLEKEIRSVLAQNKELARNAELLCTIPGIGRCTAAVILAELPDPKHFTSASQAAAYAGLTPAQRESGSSVHGKTRLCKTGNHRLRKALYLPAVVASRSNPLLKARAERLLATGKTKMCVIGATMHHLLRLAYGILKHRKPFDVNFAVQLKSA